MASVLGEQGGNNPARERKLGGIRHWEEKVKRESEKTHWISSLVGVRSCDQSMSIAALPMMATMFMKTYERERKRMSDFYHLQP